MWAFDWYQNHHHHHHYCEALVDGPLCHSIVDTMDTGVPVSYEVTFRRQSRSGSTRSFLVDQRTVAI